MPVSFPVLAVEPAVKRLPQVVPRFCFGEVLAQWAGERPLVAQGEENALAQAVALAWAHHYPLHLSPDAVWLTVLGGLARHIAHEPETVRDSFVRHDGKAVLKVEVLQLPESHADWLAVLEAFGVLIEDTTVAEWASWSVCDFSTSGPRERAASRIMLMSSLAPYFQYELDEICGIPSVTLEGEAADWEAIRERASLLSRTGLAWWLAELIPVLDEFVKASRGEVDQDFWRGIYTSTPPGGCSADEVDGWIHALFPYFDYHNDGQVWVNPYFKGLRDALLSPAEGCGGMSAATINVTTGGASFPVRILGGLIGVSQDPVTLALRAEAGMMLTAIPRPESHDQAPAPVTARTEPQPRQGWRERLREKLLP